MPQLACYLTGVTHHIDMCNRKENNSTESSVQSVSILSGNKHENVPKGWISDKVLS